MLRELLRPLFWQLRPAIQASGLPALILSRYPRPLSRTQNNYQPFIVLSHQRSGSTMLTKTLNQHPAVVTFGEAFVFGRMGLNVAGFDNHDERLLTLRNNFPRAFLEHYLFAPYPSHVQAVGFKLFPEQIESFHFRWLWDWIAHHPEVKIIYLTRSNLLATYTSLRIAMKDQQYSITGQSDRTRSTVRLTPEDCLAEFEQRQRYHEQAMSHLQGNPVLAVDYEQATQDLPAYLQQVQDFLGVDRADLSVSMVKQEVRSLDQVIENYDELRRYFVPTQWAYLFE